MPARALYHGVPINVTGDRITTRDDPEMEEWLQRMVDAEMLPTGYFANIELQIVALLEALGATIVERPQTPPAVPGRIY